VSGRPITPGGSDHRFPGFDVLQNSPHWDDATAGVVLSRLSFPPDIRFFSPSERAIAEALLAQLLHQLEGPTVPVVQMLDAPFGGRADRWVALCGYAPRRAGVAGHRDLSR